VNGQVVLLSADIALASRGSSRIDISEREGADAPFVPGTDLPFLDRTVATLALGDAVALLSVRDQVQLLSECRRVLAAGGQVRLAEAKAAETYARLARWAALVGLSELPENHGQGWIKHAIAHDPEPLVSILIPSSNPRYFLECLDSAIAQTYRNVEIIVSDDSEGSEIPAMVASRADRADIRLVQNPVRLRTRSNYAQCLSLARGEFIKYLNDDDVLAPNCVRTLLSGFQQIPDVTLATSHRLRIDAQSNVMDDMPATLPAVPCDVVVNGVSLANAAIIYGLNFIGEPSTALFRKRGLEQLGDADGGPFQFAGEEVRGAIDFAMWTRLLARGNAVFFNTRLSSFRIHGEQAQARSDVVARSVDGIRGLQHKWIELGLFRSCPPHLLLCQPFPRPEAQADDWFLEPVRSFAPSPVAPNEALRAWRETKHHAFDFTAAS
jgi:glycosyltransferase involved in cell wall biosynthesis